jgi:disulfide bond formation protein DsbB
MGMNCTSLTKICTFITQKHIQYFLIAMAVTSLAFAFTAEYGFNIKPCDFCLYERCIYAIVIILGLLSLRTKLFSGNFGIFTQLLILSIGIALTFYHVGMEQHWWVGPASCTGPTPAATFEDFRAQLMKLSRPRCDQISWALFGISATLWNLMLQAGLAFITSLGLYLREK